MLFVDESLSTLDPENQTGLASLLQHLCGEKVAIGCRGAPLPPCQNCQFCVKLVGARATVGLPSLALEDLNDILLLVDQFPLGEAFFQFFLSAGRKEITFEQLKGIIRFKGYALLGFGNIRFAYRTLYKLSKEICWLGCVHGPDTTSLKDEYAERRNAAALPQEISADKTWSSDTLPRAMPTKILPLTLPWRPWLVSKAKNLASRFQRRTKEAVPT